MANKNDLIKSLDMVRIGDNLKKRHYVLSYKIKSSYSNKIIDDPQYMNVKDIMWYFYENYKFNQKIDQGKLLNDIVVFKSYKEDLKVKIDKDNLLFESFAGFITIIAIAIAIAVGFLSIDPKVVGLKIKELKKIKDFYITNFDFVFNMLKVLIVASIIYVIIYLIATERFSKYNKLMTVNNIIYNLETIKDILG